MKHWTGDDVVKDELGATEYVLLGNAQSIFRNRHERVPLYKKTRSAARAKQTVYLLPKCRGQIREYFRRVRELRKKRVALESKVGLTNE
jgi:hypothetical protein